MAGEFLIPELGLGFSPNSIIGMDSKLEETLVDQFFLWLACQDIDVLGTPTWLDLEGGEII